jgi:hypothetical protein
MTPETLTYTPVGINMDKFGNESLTEKFDAESGGDEVEEEK